VIALPSGVRVWLAAGATDMRRGFDGLSRQVQEVLGHDPFSGHLFVFRGRRGRARDILPPSSQIPGRRIASSR
jgi:transposase